MRFEDITVEMLQQALNVYVGVAYENAPLPLTVKTRVNFIREFAGDSLADLLAHDVVEQFPPDAEGPAVTGYAIRLGNDKYPHMKLALLRVAENDWRFAVDCHDGAFEVEPTSPDKPRAQALKDCNSALRSKVEDSWRDADLPVIDEA